MLVLNLPAVKRNKQPYKHLNGSSSCKRKCSVDCFKIVDSANSRHCRKLKEAIYISHLKPEIMHQSIPAVPTSLGQPRGICLRCQSRGWSIYNFIAARGLGISVPRGDPRAFDTRVFERWMSLSGRTKPLLKTDLSVRD